MISRLIVCVLLCLSGFSMAQELPAPKMSGEVYRGGEVSVSPDSGVSGEFGTWTVQFQVGPKGIVEGGGIRVQLPDEWHSGPRNSANLLQSDSPAEDHYVSARTSHRDVSARAVVESQQPISKRSPLVKHEKESLDGRLERYVYVVRAVLEQGALREGDWVELVYGDTSGGSRGLLASAVSTGPLPILMAVDDDGDTVFGLHESRPLITAKAGLAATLLAHLPSQASAGEPMRLRLALMDRQFNPAAGPAEVALSYPDGVSGPATVQFNANQTHVDVEVMPAKIGVIRLGASWDGGTVLSNPAEISETPAERQLYWGDLHSHTKYSWDGVGTDSFDYARYTSGTDFYAMTDHSKVKSQGINRGLNEEYWDAYHAEVDAHHVPGEFVTIHAYECSFREPYGHHNVYFRHEPGALRYPSVTTLPELWEALEAGNALTIPHHTGKFPSGVDLTIHDSRFRRNFEIYSGHGLSETYNPTHPLAFEFSTFTSDATSVEAPTYIQDAWRLGLHVSAIAASDDHRSRPALPHYGIAAVRATELTRDGVFGALHDRHTYATTGAKIILHFSVNGVEMGQTGAVRDENVISVRVHGTDALLWVELLRLDGDAGFEVVQRWKPESFDFETQWTDPEELEQAVYYVRLRQVNQFHERPVMAWSSPVWLSR